MSGGGLEATDDITGRQVFSILDDLPPTRMEDFLVSPPLRICISKQNVTCRLVPVSWPRFNGT